MDRGKGSLPACSGPAYQSIGVPGWFCQSQQGQAQGSACPGGLPPCVQAGVGARHRKKVNEEGAVWGAGGRLAAPVPDCGNPEQASVSLAVPGGGNRAWSSPQRRVPSYRQVREAAALRPTDTQV